MAIRLSNNDHLLTRILAVIRETPAAVVAIRITTFACPVPLRLIFKFRRCASAVHHKVLAVDGIMLENSDLSAAN